MERYGMVWNGMEWYGMVFFLLLFSCYFTEFESDSSHRGVYFYVKGMLYEMKSLSRFGSGSRASCALCYAHARARVAAGEHRGRLKVGSWRHNSTVSGLRREINAGVVVDTRAVRARRSWCSARGATGYESARPCPDELARRHRRPPLCKQRYGCVAREREKISGSHGGRGER
jgi:hypothetical protein